MDKKDQLAIRIRYFSLLIGLYVIIHIVFALTHPEIHNGFFYIYSSIYLILLSYLFFTKRHPTYTLYLFVLSLNGYIMLEYTTEMTYSYVIFLAYPVFLAAYFQNFRAVFTVIGITYMELFFIFSRFSDSFSNQIAQHDIELILFFSLCF